MPTNRFETVDEYVEAFPENVRTILEKLRVTIRKAVPEAVESISYDMPTFKLDGKSLVYFSAWKHHIGFYSIPEGNEVLGSNCLHMRAQKARFDFPWKNQFRTIWSTR